LRLDCEPSGHHCHPTSLLRGLLVPLALGLLVGLTRAAIAAVGEPGPGEEAVAVYRPAPPAPPLDARVDATAFRAFEKMASESGGQVVTASSSGKVPERLAAVLATLSGEGPLDVALVVDVTGSMSDDLEELERTVGEIADRFFSRPAPSRLAVVWYTDRGDSLGWVSSVGLALTSSRPKLESAFASAPHGGGGDTPEHAYHGLRTAVRELEWGPMARRAAIIIGDAPPHEDYDDPAPDQIRREVAAAKVTVSTVLIGAP
jgi:hypothetical protein